MTDHDPLGLIGTSIDDKYLVERLVGEGGFGIVYRATHKLWQKPVAIKCFKTLMDASPAMREKLLQDFIQEGALLTELSARSASIVQARDVGTLITPNGAWVPYMVLEWLEGRTLEERLAAEPGAWSLSAAVEVLGPVALALDVAHGRNIAHRDVKPANIFLVREASSTGAAIAQVKLLDFGIAKVVQSAAEQGFTKTGGAVTSFTPAYGAPEQFSRAQGATGPWTDVYALALILTELLSGRLPLEGEDFIQLGMSTANPARRPTPRMLGAQVTDVVEQVMQKALAIRPGDRYASAGAFWSDLRDAAGLDVATQSRALDSSRQAGVASRPQTSSTGGLGVAATVQIGGLESSQPEALLRGPAAISANPSTLSPKMSLAPGSNGAAAKKGFSPLWLGLLGAVVVGGGGLAVLAGRQGGLSGPGPRNVDSSPPSSIGAMAAASSKPEASSPVGTAAMPLACPSEMTAIPGGEFFMGSDAKTADADEKPAHHVLLSPYCMDTDEVTVARYRACSKIGKCKPAVDEKGKAEVDWSGVSEVDRKLYSPLCTLNDPEAKANHPINCVSWEMADIYCKANKKRLPTEAEWEFAARGSDGRTYPWGNESPDATRLNACGKECLVWANRVGAHVEEMFNADDGYPATAPVGSFPGGKTQLGLLDMVGNVWEWTADWEAPYTSVDAKNPTGAPTGKTRIIRGGAFNSWNPGWVRPSKRFGTAPDSRTHAIGFRCAADP